MHQHFGGAAPWGVVAVALLLVFALAPASAHHHGHPSVEENVWHGFLACGIMYPTAMQPTTCPGANTDPNNDVVRVFEAQPGLKTVVVAMDWDIVPTNLQGTLQNALFVGQPAPMGQNAVARVSSLPAIEYRVDADPSQPLLDWDHNTEPFDLTFRVGAGKGDTPDLNIVYQQPFAVHYHLFYGEHAPHNYTALP